MKTRTGVVGVLAVVLISGAASSPAARDLAEMIGRAGEFYLIQMKPDLGRPGEGRGGRVHLNALPNNKVQIAVFIPGQGPVRLVVEPITGTDGSPSIRVMSGGVSIENKPHGTVECKEFDLGFPDETKGRTANTAWPAPESQWKVDRVLKQLESEKH